MIIETDSTNPSDGAHAAKPVEQLLKLIAERGLLPGDKLPSERELSQMLHVSRATLREAMVRLETLRVIELRPKSGAYLPTQPGIQSVDALLLFNENQEQLSEQEVREAVEMRRIVELRGLELACQRRTEANLQYIYDVLLRSEHAVRIGQSLHQLDEEFHLGLLSCTHNNMLLKIANVYYLFSRRQRKLYFTDHAQGPRSLNDHWQLYEAVKAQDTEAALRVMNAHLVQVGAFYDMFFGHEPIQKSI
jgi:GntR family transcriptional repressor for pyruvate dehydrogenase complex